MYRTQHDIISAARSGLYDIAGSFPTQHCMHTVCGNADNMGLVPMKWRDPDEQCPQGKGRYGDLMLCRSIWCCPLCSFLILQGRAAEIAALISAHLDNGGRVVLLTLTAPHTRADALATRMDRFTDANRRFLQRRAVKRLKKQADYIGGIYSKEHTWGQAAGFHYHLHVLWFVSGDADPDQLARSLYPEWAAAATSAGLPRPSRRHGLDARMGNCAADYIAKLQWDLSSEMALTDFKRGSSGRFTPFQLAETGRWDLFFEYQRATYGRDRLTGISALSRTLTGFSSPEDAGLIAAYESRYSDKGFIAPAVYKSLRRTRLDETALSIWEHAQGDIDLFFDFAAAAIGGRSASPASPFFMGLPSDVHASRAYEILPTGDSND